MRKALPALVLAALVAAAGCGGDDKPSSGLSWDGRPNVFRAAHLPNDRVVVAHVRNVGSKTLYLVASKVVVRDAAGHRLKSSAGFTPAFAHGLFGALQQPNPVPKAELLRLGKIVYLPAGATAPFFAAWTLGPKTKEPVTIDYGSGSLDVPAATATAAG